MAGQVQDHTPPFHLHPEKIPVSRSTHKWSLLPSENITRAVVAVTHRFFRLVVGPCLWLTPITESVGSTGVGTRHAVRRRGGGP